jgi:LAO/AO transport system kinase
MADLTRHLLDELTLNEDNAKNNRDKSTTRFRKRMALARAITLVESKHATHRQQADLLLTSLLAQKGSTNNSASTFRLGIAGPPGAGKSTWIETFGTILLNPPPVLTSDSAITNNDKDSSSTVSAAVVPPFHPSKLAVLCIDPSSTVTGGSILGDKTRMMELARHEMAYVRPSSNGGTFGGLSAYTHDVVSLCQAASYDLVLVESVGLGQSEVEICESVDMLILMIPPGCGDELQGVKKGIMEVADMVIVNKADGMLLPAARATASEYRAAVQFIRPRARNMMKWRTPVVLTSAYAKTGVEEVWTKILQFRTQLLESGELHEKRKRQSRYWMWKNLQNLILQQTRENANLRNTAQAMERALDDNTITPRVAAATLLDSLVSGPKT